MTDEPYCLTPKEAARAWGVSVQTVWRMCEHWAKTPEGDITARKIGHQWRIFVSRATISNNQKLSEAIRAPKTI